MWLNNSTDSNLSSEFRSKRERDWRANEKTQESGMEGTKMLSGCRGNEREGPKSLAGFSVKVKKDQKRTSPQNSALCINLRLNAWACVFTHVPLSDRAPLAQNPDAFR